MLYHIAVAKENYDTAWEPLRLYRRNREDEAWADLFLERGVMQGGIGHNDFCVLTFKYRSTREPAEFKLTREQLRRLATFLGEYADRMAAAAEAGGE